MKVDWTRLPVIGILVAIFLYTGGNYNAMDVLARLLSQEQCTAENNGSVMLVIAQPANECRNQGDYRVCISMKILGLAQLPSPKTMRYKYISYEHELSTLSLGNRNQ